MYIYISVLCAAQVRYYGLWMGLIHLIIRGAGLGLLAAGQVRQVLGVRCGGRGGGGGLDCPHRAHKEYPHCIMSTYYCMKTFILDFGCINK